MSFSLGTILCTLGLVPAEARTVKPIPQHLRELVPAPVDNNVTVKPHTPDIERETMPLIVEKAKRCAWQSKKLSAKLKGATLAATLRNASKFILDYIKYRKDDAAHEQIRSPRRLVYDCAGDCDCFAVFIATVLINNGIDFRFRLAKYGPGDWGHIYIVVPKDQRNHKKPLTTRNDYYVLDPVTNRHDFEKNFLDHKDYDMALQFLDGFPDRSPLMQNLSGLGCACGVTKATPTTPPPSQGGTISKNLKDLKGSYVISKKTLQDRGLQIGSEYLEKTGLPFIARETPDGAPYYEVTTPSGAKRIVNGFVPTDTAKQNEITTQLMTATPEPATLQASAGDITPGKIALGIGGVLLAFAIYNHVQGNNASAKGLGALPRKKKKLPVVHI